MNCENTISTGFQSLDKVLNGGLHGGSLNVIAARPGMGKTIFALQCAAGMAKNTGKIIYYYLLEMFPDYVKEKYAELCVRGGVILDSAFILDDTAPITLSQIRTRLAGISDLGGVFIDCIQFLQSDGDPCGKSVSIADEISRELKRIAREFDIPVICTSRLPRSLEKRRDCRPILKDLDEVSGGLMQDADVILFLYRHAYYGTEDLKDPPGAEIIVAKNRFGSTANLPFRFEGNIPQFSEKL